MVELTPVTRRGPPAKKRKMKAAPATLTLESRKSSSSPSSKRRPAASLLRRIPLEILERFYILSRNVNLPMAHPALEAALCSRATRLAVITATFDRTWWENFIDGGAPQPQPQQPQQPQSPSGSWLQKPYYGEVYPGDRVDDARRGECESAVLEQEWCTFEMLSQAQHDWAVRECQRRQKKGRHPDSQADFSRSRCYRMVFGSEGEDSQAAASTPRNRFADVIELQFRPPPCTWRDMFAEPPPYARNVSNLTRIPPRLVRGPFTDASLRKLYWIMRANVISSLMMLNWEVVFEGFNNALSQMAVELPLARVAFKLLRVFETSKSWPAWRVEETKERVAKLAREGGPAVTEVLREAVPKRWRSAWPDGE